MNNYINPQTHVQSGAYKDRPEDNFFPIETFIFFDLIGPVGSTGKGVTSPLYSVVYCREKHVKGNVNLIYFHVVPADD